MLELPEARTVASQIAQTLTGRRVTDAKANASPHKFCWYEGAPEHYGALLTGLSVTGALSCGGLVRLLLDGAEIVFTDGASPRYLAPDAEMPKKHQLLMTFDDGSGLYASIAMYGGIQAYPEGAPKSAYYDAAATKPSPLSDEFTKPYFDSLRAGANGKLSVKAFLATEQRVPGLGNGVLQDILFAARVSPRRKMADVSDAEYETLYRAVRETLRAMTEQGGRDVEKDFFGNPGGYRTVLSKNTCGAPCPVCGGAIRKEAYMGGSVYYCPACQQ